MFAVQRPARHFRKLLHTHTPARQERRVTREAATCRCGGGPHGPSVTYKADELAAPTTITRFSSLPPNTHKG
ncbi:hypothetical protein E2C01_101774 [Portunus trituberculatus]|uniref:Uncharacterized protein n=1 Tax=Portunus trituberculatus TaxID=210409 RepID=A0A5B7KGW1_PORTR|nr:hypothetical protein [Portunus trituberculatus]